MGSDFAVLCLVDSKSDNRFMMDAIAAYLSEEGTSYPTFARIIGGTASVPESVYGQITNAMTWNEFTLKYR